MLLVGAYLAFALGCVGGEAEDEPDWGPPAPLPTLVAEDTRVLLRPGETTTLTWRVQWPDAGGRPEDVLLQVAHARGFDERGATWRTDFWRGEEVRYTFTAGREGVYPVFQPTASVVGASVYTDVPVAGRLAIQVIGGPADAVVTPVDHIDLGLGEVRPFTAYAAGPLGPYEGNENPFFGLRLWSDDPLAYATDDPRVAQVDAEGVITAVGVGDTVLRVTAGAAETSVPIHVADVPLGLPPLGALRVFDHEAELYNPNWLHPVGPLETKSALDARGWPMLALTTRPGRGDRGSEFEVAPAPTVLARWTGTGFGYETLPVAPYLQYPVLTVDEGGHVYLLLHDGRSDRLLLYDRPGDVETGGWQAREIPRAGAPGGPSTELVGWGPGHMDWLPTASLPRSGGGVWLAVHAGDAAGTDASGCPIWVRLFEVTEAAIGAQDLSACGAPGGGGPPVRMALRPPEGGSASPSLVWLGEKEPGIAVWSESGGRWSAESKEVIQATFDLTWDDVVPIVPVGGSDDLLWIEENDRATVAWQGRRDGERHVLPTGPATQLPVETWADGDPLHPAPTWWTAYAGHATDRSHLYLFAAEGAERSVRLYTRRMPYSARTTDTFQDGARMPDDLAGFRPEAAHLLPSGARYVRYGEMVQTSEGPAGAWREITEAASRLSPAFTWVEGDTLHYLRATPGTPGTPLEGLGVERAWDGAAWSTVRTFPVPGTVGLAVARPGGGAWVLTTDGGGVLLPARAADPVVPLTGTTLRPLGPTLAGIAPHPDGGMTVVISLWDRIFVTSFAADGVARSSQSEQMIPGAMGQNLLRTASGRLLLPGWPDWQDPSTQGLWISDDDGRSWTWLPLGDAQWSSGMNLLRLGDDRLALVGTRGHAWFGHQVAYVLSEDDGETWSEPTWVRPEGGSVQNLGPVALGATGSLLLFFSDNEQGLVPTPEDFFQTYTTPDVAMEVTP